MLDAGPFPPLRAVPAPALPIAKLVVGKPVEEAAELLPRLFNLCRMAQQTAARAAFGLPLDDGWPEQLRAEILREHIAKLCLKWPALLSMPSLPLPRDWMKGSAEARVALFGDTGRMPQTPDAFDDFLTTQTGIAPLLRAISQLFEPGQACRRALPFSRPQTLFDKTPQENSVAARQSAHPVVAYVAARLGRGPLWSATALAYDLEATMHGQMPAAHLSPGRAIVPAARGYYGVTARIDNGQVAAFDRVTPTDHLLAPGGALEQSLASFPPHRTAAALGPVLMALLDPCYPVSLQTAPSEEMDHA